MFILLMTKYNVRLCSYDHQEVSQQRYTQPMKQRIKMIGYCFETQGRHHQKSKTRYQWLRKKSHCPWGPQDLLSQTFKQFITLHLKKQKRQWEAWPHAHLNEKLKSINIC